MANTLLKDLGDKKGTFYFLVFMLSVPVGFALNRILANSGLVFGLASIFISGMMLHVIWHMLEVVKQKNIASWVLLVAGVLIGYGLTLFH